MLLCTLSIAIEAQTKLHKDIIDAASPEGVAFFKRDTTPNAIKLLSHYTTQQTLSYCGIASAVMVLNASNKAPSIDKQHTPYHYFTQDNFFDEQVTAIVTPEEVEKNGINLNQLSEALQSFGLSARPYYSNEFTEQTFKHLLTTAIANQQFIIVNFLRTNLQQIGNGHHSPLAAYDEETDRFLLLDVARYKYSAYWIKSHDLWLAVHTIDGDNYRGVIIISE